MEFSESKAAYLEGWKAGFRSRRAGAVCEYHSRAGRIYHADGRPIRPEMEDYCLGHMEGYRSFRMDEDEL